MHSIAAKTTPMMSPHKCVQSISFGTDGWRAVIAEDFTFANVRLVARAIARYLTWSGRQNLSVYSPDGQGTYGAQFRPATSGLVIGYDTRFLSARFARAAAGEVATMGVPVHFCDEVAPTPAISLAVRDLNSAGAIIITASHNPAEYNGMKFKPEYASSGLPEVMDAILPFVREEQEHPTPPTKNPAPITNVSPLQGFHKALRNLVDTDRIEKSDLDIVVDAMHGAGTGIIRSLLPRVREVRATPDPLFGGFNPEPIEKNLGPLLEALRNDSRGVPPEMRIGVATDGDADRVGAIDATGHFFNSHEIFAAIMWHLVRRKGWAGGVVKTFSTSEMVGRLARHLGLPVYETPIGFKYIVENMLSHDILMGGEESGGLGVKNHIPERDGLLSSLLLLEAAAWENESLRDVLKRIQEITGHFAYDRTDLHLTSRDQMASAVESLRRNPPKSFAGRVVERVETLDGVKLVLDNDAWILFRPSGTEPVLRLYVEARTRDEVEDILREGVRQCRS